MCSKTICNGCVHSNTIRQLEENLEESCPFCRHPAPDSDDEIKKDLMRRIEVNDPAAMRHMAELGDATAHYLLSCMYHARKGVRRDKRRRFIIWKKLLLVGIHLLETILHYRYNTLED
ncbi:hypothetical protein QTG54_003294 [Skeletonema marinoi]|uniref:RING-type domain-containing protein n=1 Tax=Skeletonema marinoi TaxID=267567 RepID=A0AAD8YHW3_9STRA|nr:hypothetical protein QTG54_003294 [Skeletonema marinoi]